MITVDQLERLLWEIKEGQTLGAITVERTIAQTKAIAYGTRVCYRVEVEVWNCHHDHHVSWLVILVEATSEGIELMRQRVSSCPVGGWSVLRRG